MILGQLYFFDAQLNALEQSLDLETYLQTEIIGISTTDKLVKKGAKTLIQNRDDFIQNFTDYLKENELGVAAHVWTLITSPEKKVGVESQSKDIPYSEFIESVFEWIDQGVRFDKIKPLFTIGSLTTDPNDLAIYYGLRVLYYVSKLRDQLLGSTSKPESYFVDKLVNSFNDTATSEQLPYFAVVTNKEFAPLFGVINSIWVPSDSADNPDDVIEKVIQIKKNFPSIMVILLERSSTPNSLYIESKLSKHSVTTGVITNTIDLSFSNETSYFDIIVKETLGIRLV